MRFFLDHDVPAEAARVLAQAGFEVTLVRDALPITATDAEVWQWAVREEYVMVTCNRDDFLRLAGGGAHSGLIVLIRRRTRIAECAALIRLLDRAGEAGLMGNINFA